MICLGNSRIHSRGYTFLEIALALAVMAVVFAAAAPLAAAGLRERKLRDGMDRISQMVAENRRLAELTAEERTLEVLSGGVSSADALEKIPAGATLFLKFPGTEWQRAAGQPWRIFSQGLVFPLSLRLQEGDHWIEVDFDFLTGGAAEERSSF